MNHTQKQQEKEYKKSFREFKYKSPDASEDYFIYRRIRIVERYLLECEETAEFAKGTLMDGVEIVDGVFTKNKMGTEFEMNMFYEELKFLKNKLKELTEPKQPEPIAAVKKDTKEQKNFKIGLSFATGEAQELYKKYKGDRGQFKKICLELGFEEKSRPYFSDTLPNNTKASKNLYNNKTVMREIYNHCIDNEIPMYGEFLKMYNLIEPE